MPAPAELDTNYGRAVIPTLITASVDDLPTCGYGSGNTMRGTIFNLAVPAAEIAATPLPLEDITTLTTWEDTETLQSDEYQAAKQRFLARTRFIWGDLESGGAFIFSLNGLIHIGVVYGFFEDMQQDTAVYRYFIGVHTYSQEGLTPSNCDEIMIGFFMEAEEVAGYPSFIAVAKSATQTLYNQFAEVEAGVFVQYGEHIPAANLATATDDPSAFAIAWVLDILPNKIWGNNIDQRILNISVPDGTLLYGAWHANVVIDLNLNPGNVGGLSDPSTGPGAFPDESNNADLTDPNASGIDASNSGFITLYNPSKSAIQQFNNFLFSGSITDAIANSLKKLIADPIDYLVFIAMVRFKPNTPDPTMQEIKFCGISSGVSSRVITPQATWIKYQSRHIDRAFLGFEDYNPFSKCSIRLPYIGWRELNIDEVMDSDVKVAYNVDCMTGTCVAQVHIYREKRSYLAGQSSKGDTKINDNMYEFTGNCFEMLPLNATDFRGLFGSIMQTAVGVASGVASGNPIGVANAVIGGASSAKVGVEHSGNMSASAGYFGDQDVVMRFERPIQSLPENYANLQGMPSNVTVKKIANIIGNGYCEFEPESLILDGMVDATKDEIEEIRSLLAAGMIF